MALTKMTKRDSYVDGFEYSETIASGETGDDIRIFPLGLDGPRITCRIIAGANTGKFQFTCSPDANVIAGTAVWTDWPKGVVTGTDYDTLLGPVTGLRGVSSAGEIKIEVVI